jgi:hypothetical protein
MGGYSGGMPVTKQEINGASRPASTAHRTGTRKPFSSSGSSSGRHSAEPISVAHQKLTVSPAAALAPGIG